jgi:uroporphyrinogen-III decarboxylase
MPRFFLWAFRYPNALKRLMERICEVKIVITEELIRKVGVDVICYGDDWGAEDRLLLSPKMWPEKNCETWKSCNIIGRRKR